MYSFVSCKLVWHGVLVVGQPAFTSTEVKESTTILHNCQKVGGSRKTLTLREVCANTWWLYVSLKYSGSVLNHILTKILRPYFRVDNSQIHFFIHVFSSPPPACNLSIGKVVWTRDQSARSPHWPLSYCGLWQADWSSRIEEIDWME